MKPTEGPWTVGTRSGFNANTIYDRSGKDAHHDKAICTVSGIFMNRTVEESELDDYSKEGMANANLIAEAGTVYHETGLTPREILAQRDYALSVLAEYEKALEDGPENLSYRRYEEISEKATAILPLFATLDATTAT
jgi:hypothetical protein